MKKDNKEDDQNLPQDLEHPGSQEEPPGASGRKDDPEGQKAELERLQSQLVESQYQPGDKLAVVVSHSRIKMGPGWTPAYNEKTIFVRDRKDKRKLVAKKVLVCPGCGKPLVDGSNIRGRRSLEKKPLTCHHTVPAWDDVEKVWEERPCATPLYQFSPTIARRWPLADYIAKKLPRFFRVLVFDEVHKGKAKDTDADEPEAMMSAGTLSGLEFRLIGPAYNSGRVTDFAVQPDKTQVIWVATATGGIWKTVNNGTTFTPLFDRQSTVSIGDVAVCPADPNVIWVGTGEEDSRNSISAGARAQ